MQENDRIALAEEELGACCASCAGAEIVDKAHHVLFERDRRAARRDENDSLACCFRMVLNEFTNQCCVLL